MRNLSKRHLITDTEKKCVCAALDIPRLEDGKLGYCTKSFTVRCKLGQEKNSVRLEGGYFHIPLPQLR